MAVVGVCAADEGDVHREKELWGAWQQESSPAPQCCSFSLSIPPQGNFSEGRVLSSAGLKAPREILVPELVQGTLSSAKDIASILYLLPFPCALGMEVMVLFFLLTLKQ